MPGKPIQGSCYYIHDSHVSSVSHHGPYIMSFPVSIKYFTPCVFCNQGAASQTADAPMLHNKGSSNLHGWQGKHFTSSPVLELFPVELYLKCAEADPPCVYGTVRVDNGYILDPAVD
jgi:hypothetical protein